MKADDVQQRFAEALSQCDVTTIIDLVREDVLDLNSTDVTHDLETPLMRLCHAEGVDDSQLMTILGRIDNLNMHRTAH